MDPPLLPSCAISTETAGIVDAISSLAIFFRSVTLERFLLDIMTATASTMAYDKNNPFPAKLVENRVLNKPGSAKDTRHFVVDISGSGLRYECGDSLGIFPTNAPEAVEEIISLLGATGDEEVTPPKAEAPVSFCEALTSYVALAGPTNKVLKAMLEKATDAAEQARLNELLDPAHKDTTKLFLEEREFADLLQEFPSCKFAPQEFIEQTRKLMPRLYSIASSPTLYPDHVHLTVAVVRYETNSRQRIGVCSTYLSDRAGLNEANVPTFVASSHFGLPEDDSVDLIMVGPGTGIAPFRSFVQERIARAGAEGGRLWVFFGDQHEATDFLYEEEWREWLDKGQISRLDLAWSRDQEKKVYVQDKMRDAESELWQWLENGAYFYVCGDAKRMAKDVDTALHDIAMSCGGKSEAEAKDFVKALKKEKRYQRDVY